MLPILFLVKNINSVTNVLKDLNLFLQFSGLCLNVTKSETVGIGVKKSVKKGILSHEMNVLKI